jgi:hypothetical protein
MDSAVEEDSLIRRNQRDGHTWRYVRCFSELKHRNITIERKFEHQYGEILESLPVTTIDASFDAGFALETGRWFRHSNIRPLKDEDILFKKFLIFSNQQLSNQRKIVVK